MYRNYIFVYTWITHFIQLNGFPSHCFINQNERHTVN